MASSSLTLSEVTGRRCDRNLTQIDGCRSSCIENDRWKPLCRQEQRLVSQMNQLDLGACFGQERLDEPMTQEQFLAQTPARFA